MSQKHRSLSIYRNPGLNLTNLSYQRLTRRLLYAGRKKQCLFCRAQAATSQQDRQHVDDVALKVLQRRIQLYAMRNQKHMIMDPVFSLSEKKKIVKQLEKQFANQSVQNLDIKVVKQLEKQFARQSLQKLDVDFSELKIENQKTLNQTKKKKQKRARKHLIEEKTRTQISKNEKNVKNGNFQEKKISSQVEKLTGKKQKTVNKPNQEIVGSANVQITEPIKKLPTQQIENLQYQLQNGTQASLNQKKKQKQQKNLNNFVNTNSSIKTKKISRTNIQVLDKFQNTDLNQIQTLANELQNLMQEQEHNILLDTKDSNSNVNINSSQQQIQFQNLEKGKSMQKLDSPIERKKTPQSKVVPVKKAKFQIKIEKLAHKRPTTQQKKKQQVQSQQIHQIDKQKAKIQPKLKSKTKQVEVKGQKQTSQKGFFRQKGKNSSEYESVMGMQPKVVVKSQKIRREANQRSKVQPLKISQPKQSNLGIIKLGKHAVLSKKQEFELTKSVYSYMKLCHTKDKFIKETGREPDLFEWSSACGFSDYRSFQKGVEDGQRALTKLVRCNFRLVGYWANKYQNASMSAHDLVSAGIFGLKRAAEKFNPHRGFRFGTYASSWIRQAINNSIQEESKVIRIPATYWDVLRKVKKLKARLFQSLEREPTVEELAQGLKMDQERLELILSRSRDPQSTHSLMNSGNPHTFEEVTADFEECSDPSVSIVGSCRDRDLDKALASLDTRQSQAITLRYGLQRYSSPSSLKQVATAMKVSLETARKLIIKGLEELKKGEMWEVLQEYCEDQGAISNIPNRPGIRHV